MRIFISTLLETRGYKPVVTRDGKEGMRKAKSVVPDLIILDVMMSTWQDGFEMARELKNHPEFRQIPVLILTSISEITGVEFKSSAGNPTWLPVDGFLEKHVDTEVLLSEIERLLCKKP